METRKIEVWICDACGAKHWPQVVAGRHGVCPTCGNNSGKLTRVAVDE